MERQKGGYVAADIRNHQDVNLKDVTGTSLTDLETFYIAVTDCTSSVICVFNASMSYNRVSYRFYWVEFITLRLSTEMKHAMSRNVVLFGLIELEFEAVKASYTLLKLNCRNSDQQLGFVLVQ